MGVRVSDVRCVLQHLRLPDDLARRRCGYYDHWQPQNAHDHRAVADHFRQRVHAGASLLVHHHVRWCVRVQ